MELIWLLDMSLGGLVGLALLIGGWYAYCNLTESGRALKERGHAANERARNERAGRHFDRL